MAKYEWRLQGMNDLDPNLAHKELSRIEKLHGQLTAAIVLEESRKRDAFFHSCFEWNNEKAAEKHRLMQAGFILRNIQIVTISNGEPKQMRVYEIVSTESGRSFKKLTAMTQDELGEVIANSVRIVNALKTKINSYKQLRPVADKLSEAEELLLMKK